MKVNGLSLGELLKELRGDESLRDAKKADRHYLFLLSYT